MLSRRAAGHGRGGDRDADLPRRPASGHPRRRVLYRGREAGAGGGIMSDTGPLGGQRPVGTRRGRPAGWGRIVNIVSASGLYGNYGQAAYASAKAGLVGLTRVVALDMQRSQVTCNAVAPFAATRVTESIRPANPAQQAYKERALTIPAAAVAALVVFLAGDEAAGITGQLLGVRGKEVFLFSQPRPVARAISPGADG